MMVKYTGMLLFDLLFISRSLVYRRIALESPNSNYITLILNTDGAEVFKSTKVSMWPMLFMINELQYSQRFVVEI